MATLAQMLLLLVLAGVLAPPSEPLQGEEPVPAAEPTEPAGPFEQAGQAEPAEAAEPPAEPSDATVAERLRAIFASVEELADVEVEVTAGVVRLTGEIDSPDSRRKAEELAAGLDGVVYVSNDLRTTANVARQVTPSLEKVLDRARELVTLLPLVAIALVVVALFALLARLVGAARGLFARLTRNKLLQGVFQQIAQTVIVLAGVFVGLEILGATTLVGAVLGTAGLVGLAIGFAFRDIVENYLASILLSVRRPFRPKDLVEIDGRQGTVIRMTTRDTVLMTPEGNHLSLPNSAVFKSAILNYTRNPLRRFAVAVGVGNDVDLKRGIALGLGVLREMAGVVDEPAPLAFVEELGASSVNLRFFGWVDQEHADFGKVRSEAVRLLKGVMDAHGIDLPVPIYQVDLRRKPAAPRREPAPAAPPAAVAREAATIDVAPERTIELQVDRDRALSSEPDLLDEPAPDEP